MAQDPSPETTPPPGEVPALGSLQSRLDAARRAEDERNARDHAPLRDEGRAIGSQVAATMLGYPIGGIIIGWGIDMLVQKLTGTRTFPWIMLAMMFLAFAGACMQVVRGNNGPKA